MGAQDNNKIELNELMDEYYLDYSMSVILGRALPDVRDGLKPVHRRILYGMHDLGLDYNGKYRKSAALVGKVLGSYHPHGDTSVYDAMVRMAQDFSMNHPLVDGQGNFGSIDGDNAAAMRYSECRFSKLGQIMLDDIEKNTVDFQPNYDSTTEEPTVLPCKLPNLLINGSTGIAVGMATNIPPHNIREIVDAVIYIIDNKNVTNENICEFVTGPDFPTGSVIYGGENLSKIYENGRGSIKIGSTYFIENDNRRKNIVINQIPYGSVKSKIVENINECVKNKIVDGINEIRDESNKDGIRVVLELKIGTDPDIIMNQLLTLNDTGLVVSYGIQMRCIINKEPKILSLLEILNEFINHRKTIIIRRTIYSINKLKDRLHILNGIKKAIDVIDEVIEIIKKSKSNIETKKILNDFLDIDDIQSQAILDMRLQRISGFEIDKIIEEMEKINTEISDLNKILSSDNEINKVIKKELRELSKEFGVDRKTKIEKELKKIDIEDKIKEEELLLVVTKNNYINSIKLSTAKRQISSGNQPSYIELNNDDFIHNIYKISNLDTILCVTKDGNAYTMKGYDLPSVEKGKSTASLFDLEQTVKIVSILPVTSDNKLLSLVTKFGKIILLDIDTISSIKKKGISIASISDTDEIINCTILNSIDEFVNLSTKDGMFTRYDLNEVRIVGRGGQGVLAMKIKDDDYLSNVFYSPKSIDKYDILTITSKGYIKKTTSEEYKLQKRGGSGIKVTETTNKSGTIIISTVFNENSIIYSISLDGTYNKIDINLKDINRINRISTGNKLIPDDVSQIYISDRNDSAFLEK